MNLSFAGASTEIMVERGLLDHIHQWFQGDKIPPVVLACSDQTVADLYADTLLAGLRTAGINVHLHTIAPGDSSKNLDVLSEIYSHLGRIGMARDGMLVALGGGVVGDITGFAAATWMRGVRFGICPTTIVANIDSAIGGKTGINHESGKNMVGAFHHPVFVAVDPECLKTLSSRDISAGLAESVKHALIRDEEFLTWHEQNAQSILAVEPEIMGELIEWNQRIKAEIVQADEREKSGQRALLNLGHTIGHAIEKWADYDLRHGEAVALGTVAAGRISEAMGLLPSGDLARTEAILKAFKLPTNSPKSLDPNRIAGLTHSDKKVQHSKRRWVLLRGIGDPVIRDDVPESVIADAIASLNKQ